MKRDCLSQLESRIRPRERLRANITEMERLRSSWDSQEQALMTRRYQANDDDDDDDIVTIL
jgi:hypothetical protein